MFTLMRFEIIGGDDAERETSSASSNESEREDSEADESSEAPKAADGVVGRWVLAEATVQGQTMTVEELAAATGQTIEVSFEFTENGDFIGSSGGMGIGDGEGTYEVDGDQVSATVDGGTVTMTLDGNKLTLSEEGVELVLVREGTNGGSDAAPADEQPAAASASNGSVVGFWYCDEAPSPLIEFTEDGE
jgi:hypothetical protein